MMKQFKKEIDAIDEDTMDESDVQTKSQQDKSSSSGGRMMIMTSLLASKPKKLKAPGEVARDR